MTVEKKEWISALADGELEGAELHRTIDRLRDDSELLDSWKYHHLIRDAIHSNLHQNIDVELHRRVAAALEREPTILAPQRRASRPWLRQAAGVAIAASVTGVAILGIRTVNEAPDTPVTVAAGSGEYVRMQPVLTAQNSEPAQKADELTPYLVNHNEYSVSSGMHGMLPYVRIVGYKVGR